MATIAKFPLGFLDLVGLQNFGENPRELAMTVSPVVDIGEQFLVSTQIITTGAVAAAAAGFNALNPALVVPPGEVWRLLGYNINVSNLAGATCTAAPALRAAPGGTRFSLSVGLEANVAVRNFIGVATAVPMWLPAGYELGIEVTNLVAGVAMSATAIYTRLRA
jgi:hypothetical protein